MSHVPMLESTTVEAKAQGRPRARSGTQGTTVELEGLSRAFGRTRALDRLDLRLEPGELFCLLGPSGCGKTTALRLVAGFEEPDEGRVRVDGVDLCATPAHRRDMGMVFQSYSLFPNLTAADNVAFGLRLRKRRRTDRLRRAGELLELVGMPGKGGQYPHQLSGGEQQRVALARALAIEPRVLLLDEPLSALDAKVRSQLREHIRSLQLQLGITTLFVTHDQEEALSIADRVGVMAAGRLQQLGTPSEIYERPQSAFIAEFVGSASRLPGAARADGGVDVLGISLEAPSQCGRFAPGTELDVLVRPEALEVRPDEAGIGVVTQRWFRGSELRVIVAVPGGVEAVATVPPEEGQRLATGVVVSLRPTRALFCEPRASSGPMGAG